MVDLLCIYLLFLPLPTNRSDYLPFRVNPFESTNNKAHADAVLRVESDLFGNSHAFSLRKAVLNEHDPLDLTEY